MVPVGTKLGPYEILSSLGAGGMGEVYKARDTRLDRTIAIKVLPAAVADDPHFRERFDREARVIAALNHPHICTLHDIGRQDGVDFLVMEYVEGQTLAERLQKGPLPIEQGLSYAVQIADALDTAHRHGIVHRDLKPANVMLTKSGVKLLDFGLAKARPAGAVAGMSVAATMPSPLTGQGTILGTLHYMSPEQVEGKEADARTDLFAFGALVYEMATGKRAFEGQSAASVMAAILEREPPPMSALQPLAPPALDHLVSRCLVKDPDHRWQSAMDIVHELRWIADTGPGAAPPGTAPRARRPWIWIAATALSVLAAASVFVVHVREARPSPRVMRYAIPLPKKGQSEGLYFNSHISPDGRFVAVSGVLADAAGIFVRELDAWDFRLLASTNTGDFFFSPDSRSIAFFDDRKLKKVKVTGGPAEVICDIAGVFGLATGTWSGDDTIVFSSPSGGPLLSVAAGGGPPRPVTTPGNGVSHLYPAFLPDGRRFLYTQRGSTPGIYTASLDDPTGRRLLADDSSALFAPAAAGGKDGHVMFIRDGRLMAQRFDPTAISLRGEGFVVADRALWNDPGSAAVSVSDAGVMTYLSGRSRETDSRLVWFDRSGRVVAPEGVQGPPTTTSLSPDEKTAAVLRRQPGNWAADLWLRDLTRGLETRFTYDATIDSTGNVVWSPDGSRIAFSSGLSRSSDMDSKTDLYVKGLRAVDQGEPVVRTENHKNPTDWSKDGVLHYTETNRKTGSDLWYLRVGGGADRTAKPVVFLQTSFDESSAQVSPDGRWIVYLSNESGPYEVYVRPFPSGSGKWKVSSSTGVSSTQQPRWSPNGKELFFLTGTAGKWTVMTVAVTAGLPSAQMGPVLEIGLPRPLFEVRANGFHPATGTLFYSVSRDGQRFLINHVESATEPVLNVIVNWEQAFAGK